MAANGFDAVEGRQAMGNGDNNGGGAKGPSGARRGGLRVIDNPSVQELEATALSAKWPDVVGELESDARESRVRTGLDTVLLDDPSAADKRRGFVRVVWRVPLDHEDAQVYSVFVEVDRDGYIALQKAFKSQTPTRVWGHLANRLPYLEDAFGSAVCIYEDGSDKRARVVDARHPLVLHGPEVGPWNTGANDA